MRGNGRVCTTNSLLLCCKFCLQVNVLSRSRGETDRRLNKSRLQLSMYCLDIALWIRKNIFSMQNFMDNCYALSVMFINII